MRKSNIFWLFFFRLYLVGSYHIVECEAVVSGNGIVRNSSQSYIWSDLWKMPKSLPIKAAGNIWKSWIFTCDSGSVCDKFIVSFGTLKNSEKTFIYSCADCVQIVSYFLVLFFLLFVRFYLFRFLRCYVLQNGRNKICIIFVRKIMAMRYLICALTMAIYLLYRRYWQCLTDDCCRHTYTILNTQYYVLDGNTKCFRLSCSALSVFGDEQYEM